VERAKPARDGRSLVDLVPDEGAPKSRQYVIADRDARRQLVSTDCFRAAQPAEIPPPPLHGGTTPSFACSPTSMDPD
jgi:hypothetical protein